MKNLAFRKAVRHSSAADYDHCGHLTTTGNENYKWISGGGGEEWLVYRLGALCTVYSLSLRWDGGYYAEIFKVQHSRDGENWETAADCEGRPGEQMIVIKPTEASHIRLLMLKPAKDKYSLIETEIYGEGGADYKNEGGWKIRRAEEVAEGGEALSDPAYDASEWLDAVVPGTALTSWLRAGAILNPDIADYQFQVSDAYFTTDYWYRWSFEIPGSRKGRRIWLNFNAVNWKADVWLNGGRLGKIEGAFMRGAFDITDFAVLGGVNILAVYIHKNANPGKVKVHTRETAGPNGGVLGADNPTIHASIGWDWVTTVRGRNVGIYGSVFLSYAKGHIRIKNPHVKVSLANKNSIARLETLAVLENTGEKPVKASFRGKIGPNGPAFESPEVTLAPGEAREVAAAGIIMKKPRLWWPNTYGEQFLYDMTLTSYENGLKSDSISFKFGVREFAYTSDWPLKIYCNGVRIICRGGNWGMDDANLACTPSDYDIKLRFHKDMNFTMIRNWVGMTNHPAFYEACDRYGVLVWDDFWLANPVDGPEPEDEAMFMANAADKVLKNRYHACIALYCGRNEGFPPESLNKALEKLCAEADGTRVYIPHSALGLVSGFGPYGAKGPHYYFGHTYHTLHSERGLLNIPSLESMKKMLTPEHEWPIDEVWALHDFCINSAQRSGEHEALMRESFGSYDSLEDFVRIAQMVDYQNHRAMFEAVYTGRSQGLLMWMSNPAWPSMTWQTYDYWYDINGGYQGCKDANRPVNAIYECLREEIYLVNATAATKTLTVKMELYDLDGKLLRAAEVSRTAPPDYSEAVMEAPRWMNEAQLLRLKVVENGAVIAVNNYWLNGWNPTDYTAMLRMKKAVLSTLLTETEGGYIAEITNASSVPAVMVEVRLRDRDSGERLLPVFSDKNFITLMPGESETITLECSHKNTELLIKGWNL